MYRHALPHPAAAEGENAVDESLPAHTRVHHLIDLVSHGAAFAQVALREFAETENRAEDVVEVVRDATGQAADRLHFRRLLQLPLHLLALPFLHSLRLLSAFALSDVHHGPDKLEVARIVRQGMGHHLEMLD